jgi:hypothetical protein
LATIFISYRRADAGWAGRLHDALEARFPVFMDSADILPGTRWPDHIRDELRDCRVFIALIGPAWVTDENLRRLGDPGDWVHEELAEALRRDDVLLLPLLVGNTAWPATARLPETLRPLGNIQNQALPDTRWAKDVKDLGETFQGWLSRRSPGRPAARPFPQVLPFLCDRTDQEEELEDLIQAAGEGKPLAFVLHGPDDEGHHGFIDRILHVGLFERLLRAQAGGVARHPINWTLERAQLGDYAGILRDQIRRRAMQKRDASDDELREFLRAPNQPTLLVLSASLQEHRQCDNQLLPGFLGAWEQLFAGLTLSPQRPTTFWINFTHPKDQACPEIAQRDEALPGLTSILGRHILDWLALPDVKPWTAGRATELQAIASDPRWSRADRSLPMLAFADAVQEVLSAR